MPEFPEVHHQVAWLRARVTGWVIEDHGHFGGHFPELKGDPARKAKLDAFFRGATLRSITQRGKHIVMSLTTGTATSHLMHAGRWTLSDEPYVSGYRHHLTPPDKKASSFWVVAGGRRLEFNEPEHRGKVRAFPGVGSADIDELKKLGPDVLITPESDPAYRAAWSVEHLLRTLAGSRKAVKELLLAQEQQAGIGNMYACEALYRAGLAPTRTGATVTPAEAAALHGAVTALMRGMIAGAPDYAAVMQVYRRETDPAGRAVQVTKVGGRDTYWVPEAQR
jgi:formamidopyrimidine-DNA glycosylase